MHWQPPEPRAERRSTHMVHQCIERACVPMSIDARRSTVTTPKCCRSGDASQLSRRAYAACSEDRLAALIDQAGWMVRRGGRILRCPAIARLSARATLHALRASSRPAQRVPPAVEGIAGLSVYGPTADTRRHCRSTAAIVVNRYSVDRGTARSGARGSSRRRVLPDPGGLPVTERRRTPDRRRVEHPERRGRRSRSR